MKNTSVLHVPILDSNYVWIIKSHITGQVIVLDPGDSNPIINYLNAKSLDVEAVFITHSHHDHIGGLDAFIDAYPVPVYGPKCDRIPQVTHVVKDNDIISFDGYGDFHVLHLPGHLPEHVGYLLKENADENTQHPALFSGDIMFSSGCGRIFDGTPKQLHHSLMRLAQLNPATSVHSSHEYTLQNLEFALTIEPDNTALKTKAESMQDRRSQGLPTLPTSIGVEKETNPFLRCGQKSVAEAVKRHTNQERLSEVEIFAELRKMKDVF